MTSKVWITLVIVFLLHVGTISSALCEELKTRYATVRYDDINLLQKFNDEIYLGRQLSQQLHQQKAFTIQDELHNKLNLIVEKVETVLDMFPTQLYVTIVLLPSSKEVQAVYLQKYGKRVNHVAYYSLSEKTIYLSVDDVNLKVLAHEIGHIVADHYFQVRPPYKIHELLAQFAEEHITD